MFGLKDAVTKLLATGILLALISGCASNTISTADSYQSPKNIFGVVYNISKYKRYSLDDEAASKHQACITTALYYSAFGDKCDWSTRKVRGTVQVADMSLNGSRVCKVIRTSIKDTSGKTFAITQRACGTGNNWKFIDG
jgi:hypothetical protein